MTNRTNHFSRVLALTLAFVIVLTGMNFGMWEGAGTAWAETPAEEAAAYLRTSYVEGSTKAISSGGDGVTKSADGLSYTVGLTTSSGSAINSLRFKTEGSSSLYKTGWFFSGDEKNYLQIGTAVSGRITSFQRPTADEGAYQFTATLKLYDKDTEDQAINDNSADALATQDFQITLLPEARKYEVSFRFANSRTEEPVTVSTFTVADGSSYYANNIKPDENGIYRLEENYTYYLTVEADGYNKISQQPQTFHASGTFDIKLDPIEYVDAAFSVKGDDDTALTDAEITVKDGTSYSSNEITPLDGRYHLQSGKNYYITIKKDGYRTITNELFIPSGSGNTEKTFVLEKIYYCTIKFNATDQKGNPIPDYTATVKGKSSYGSFSITIPAEADGSFRLEKNSEYQYEISAKNYTAKTGKITPDQDTAEITVSLEKDITEYQVEFLVKDENDAAIPNSSIKVYRENSYLDPTEILPSEGKYALVKGPSYYPNTFTYEVSAPGYDTVRVTGYKPSGDEENYTIPVVLKKLNIVTFIVSPQDAELKLLDAEKKTQTPLSIQDGEIQYALKTGTYTYTASKFGYVTEEADIEVSGDTTKSVTLTAEARWNVTFDISTPDGISAVPVLVIKEREVIRAEGTAKSYQLPNGTYDYTVSCVGCDDKNGSFTVHNGDVTIDPITLIKAKVFSDFFETIKNYADVQNGTEYGFAAAKLDGETVLASQNKGIDGSTAVVQLNVKKSGKISFAYKVESEDRYDKVTVKRNDVTIVTDSGKKDWNICGFTASAGDIVIIQYTKDSSTAKYSDSLYLKDFTAAAIAEINFINGPRNAVVTVKKDGETVSGEENKYTLESGEYTYSVEAFGYQSIPETKLTVSETSQDIDISMQKVPTAKLNFYVLPSGIPNIAVKVVHPTAGDMEEFKQADGSFELPQNETYAYTVSAANYGTVNGETMLDSRPQTITVTLKYLGTAWDGTSKTEPEKVGDVYQIGTAAELAWFAEKVNAGNTDYNAKLTANINLNHQTWTSIGDYTHPFIGSFDGDYKTISGLKGSNGLFDTIESQGTLKNLALDDVEISGSANIGGAAGSLKGKIENVVVSGTISSSSNSTGCGGIVGRIQDNGEVSGCVNKATVKNTTQSYGSELKLGGIAGYNYNKITNCYNLGSISAREDRATNSGIGGLAGTNRSTGRIENSYNIGTVTGPANGIGAVIGSNEGQAVNTYYLQGTAANAVAKNTAAAAIEVLQKTAEEMKTDNFAYTLGDAFYKDTDLINNGFPVLRWQGGSAPSVPQFEQDAEEALRAIIMKDLDRAAELAAQKKAIDDEIAADGRNAAAEESGAAISEEEFQKNYAEYLQMGLELWKELFEEPDMTLEDIYEVNDIDLRDDGTLTPDIDNKYQVQKTMHLQLPASGEKGTRITWTSSNPEILNPEDGTVTLPAIGKETVTLTAAVTKGEYTKTKEFSFVVWSQNNNYQEILDNIKAKAEKNSTFIQPLQIYNHANITQAMEQWIARQEYPVEGIDVFRDAEDSGAETKAAIKVTFVSAGTQSMPKDGNEYIKQNGDLEYFKGTEYGYATQYAIYQDVTFKLEYEGAETEVKVRAHIGWDTAYVETMLNEAMEKVTWDTIKGSNTNTARQEKIDSWMHTVVEGDVTGDLTLPYAFKDFPYATVKWAVVKQTAQNMDSLYVADNGDGTFTATPERPAMGQGANRFTMKAIAVFNFWDDYTVAEYTSMNGKEDPAESFKMFALTVPANDTDQSEEISAALEKYPGLLRDFVNKQQSIDTGAVTNDLQMPRPSILEDAGIMTDSYYQKVTMTSSNTDVLNFNGYHAEIYRPLPGEDAAEVSYTIRILDRRNNAVLGEKTFTLTVTPLTQAEIDDAAAWMNKISTTEVYWNGIKGENTSKDEITADLDPFVEILRGENDEVIYTRGMANITFGGAEADDLPGYDAMKPQPWREFRSSKHNILACETLSLTQPEYNTKVKIDSVLTDNTFGKYWKKFSGDDRYAQFEQFYKRPVAVTVTVIGSKGIPDPTPQPTSIQATVSIDGKGSHGFRSSGKILVSGLDPDTATAWDAVIAAFKQANYSYSGFGDYVASITDPNGVTLTDNDTPNSGWLYTVNGKMPNIYMGAYYLSNNDVIHLYYTADYKTDPAAGAWDDTLQEVTTVGASGSAITTAPTEVKVTEKTEADGTKVKVAEVTVSAENQKEILKQAKENKSAEIILNVTKDAVGEASAAETKLDKSFLESILKDTDAKLTIKTPFGSRTYTQEELKALTEAAAGTTVTLEVKAEEDSEAAKLAQAKEQLAKVSLTARSVKTAKKNVKVTLKTNAKTDAAIKEIQALGYTVKYKFYRGTKKSSGYTAKLTKETKSYVNTAGTKGKAYYYKARVMVYDQNGKLVAFSKLTQCKYASRIWTK